MFKGVLSFYNALSIAKKLKFLGYSSAVIAGSIVLSMLFIFQYASEKEHIVKESKIFANILANNIAPAILSNDLISISNILSSVEYNEKITQTFALDNSWKIIGAFHKGSDYKEQRKIVLKIKKNKNLWKDGHFYSVVPIVEDDVELGYLAIVSSLDEFYIRVVKHAIVIIFVILIALLITSRFRKVLQNSILHPIANLDDVTTQIIKTKNLNHDIKIFNNDEIGDLAKNFKYMINQLNSYHYEINEQKEILSHQASYDSLTNLPNRSLFYDRLEQNIHKASRHNEKFALFFIDLDQFKEVNDTFGHEYGDKLLQQVALRLKSVLREDDTLARLGGDEFVVIMTDLKEFHSASVLAQKILDILELPIDVEDQDLFISCSIGISLYPDDSCDSQELLKHADIAMYRSKEEGRNAYSFYVQEMTEQVLKRVDMQSKIRTALEEKEFIVHYQPQYDMLSEKIIGLEALARWENPDVGLMMPIDFIHYAQEFGMIVGINRHIMHLSMIQAREWYDEGLYFGRISINISIEQIESEKFVDFVKNLLVQTDSYAYWFALELTEGQMMSNTDTAVKVLSELSALGIEISIDDFGTGYSSLSYLKNLPINKLKIDRSFIKDIPEDKDDMAIVEAIIAVSKSLNFDIIAEGVETVAQKEFLISRGCFNVQGFLYGRAVAPQEISKKLLLNSSR